MIGKYSEKFACAFLLLLLLSCYAFAAEFSADMAISSKTAGAGMTGKVFVKGKAMRQEMNTPVGVQTVIIPAEGSVMYVLMPGQKMYMEMPNSQVVLDEQENIETKLSKEGKLTKKETETVEGYICDVYFMKYNNPEIGESTLWISRDLNYPIKIHTVNPTDTATITYTNISRKSLSGSLFTLPPGFKKFSMPRQK